MLLLIDDDPDFLVHAETHLPPDCPALFASDAKQAWGLLSMLGPDAFSAAIIDLNLPGEHGFSLILKFRKQFPALPIIAISGTYVAGVLETAKALGATEALAKPITREWGTIIKEICARPKIG